MDPYDSFISTSIDDPYNFVDLAGGYSEELGLFESAARLDGMRFETELAGEEADERELEARMALIGLQEFEEDLMRDATLGEIDRQRLWEERLRWEELDEFERRRRWQLMGDAERRRLRIGAGSWEDLARRRSAHAYREWINGRQRHGMGSTIHFLPRRYSLSSGLRQRYGHIIDRFRSGAGYGRLGGGLGLGLGGRGYGLGAGMRERARTRLSLVQMESILSRLRAAEDRLLNYPVNRRRSEIEHRAALNNIRRMITSCERQRREIDFQERRLREGDRLHAQLQAERLDREIVNTRRETARLQAEAAHVQRRMLERDYERDRLEARRLERDMIREQELREIERENHYLQWETEYERTRREADRWGRERDLIRENSLLQLERDELAYENALVGSSPAYPLIADTRACYGHRDPYLIYPSSVCTSTTSYLTSPAMSYVDDYREDPLYGGGIGGGYLTYY